MKGRFYLALSLMIVLSLVASVAALAQSEPLEPPNLRVEHDPSAQVGLHEEASDANVPPHHSRFKLESRTAKSLDVPGVNLGKPGLAYRIDKFFGVTAEPYPVDTVHINGPAGIFIDNLNNLYVAEAEGSRLLRYNSSGQNTLSIGTAGWYDVYDGNLDWPQDALVDGNGDIWVADASRVTRYSSSGEIEMSFPSDLEMANDCLSDNAHFCYPEGLAMDSGGRLYVSDTQNHRIQVFTVSGDTLVYSTTIGIGGQGVGNNQFNWPARIAFNGAGQLFVADGDNYRVQKCSYGPPWTCTTFHGVSGVPGDDGAHLDYVSGVNIDSAGNVYIADEGNWRVKKCTSGGSCANFVVDFYDPVDVAFDSQSNVYISSWYNSYTIQKFSSTGSPLGIVAGTLEEAYVGDASHIYLPHGIGVDGSGNLYISERMGNRWLKLDKDGNRVWTKGDPGMRLNDQYHFGDSLYGNPGIGADNKLYLPSGNARCVRIYDLNGVYQNATLGTCQGSTGDSGTLFGNVAGVAISPLNGNVYVVDRGNQKVKIFNSSRSYLGFIGQGLGSTGFGSGSYQFNEPMGIAVDKNGNIYVADRMNHRVQKYNSSGVFQSRIGVTGNCNWSYDYLCAPTGVAVDSDDRVYIAENWNQRVSIYDSTGAYLNTIGGRWGITLGRLNGPAGVAVAADGTVYITEQYNHRVQAFKRGAIGWAPFNINGFGDPSNESIFSLEAFGSHLYAGTYHNNGAQIWRYDDLSGWTNVVNNGFGEARNIGINDLVEFEGNLYAGTWSDAVIGAEIWRSDTGNQGDWQQVVDGGFNDTSNGEIQTLIEFKGSIYAGTVRYDVDEGVEIWRSPSGDAGTWELVVDNGLGNPENLSIHSSEVYSDHLFVGVYGWDYDTNSPRGAEIWRTSTGDLGAWSQVNPDEFGTISVAYITSLEVFDNDLYALTINASGTGGAQIWKCHLCDGTDWTQVVDNGYGDAYRNGMSALIAIDGYLYWVTANRNPEIGLEVWRTTDGAAWTQVGSTGFGDPNNYRTYWGNAVAEWQDNLMVGTWNWADGGEIWTYLDSSIYLPVVRR